MSFSKFICVITFTILILSVYAQLRLPSPDVFLGTLFNVTVGEVINIAKNFDFYDVEANDIDFLFFNEDHNKYLSLKMNSKNLDAINSSSPTKFIIHGWLSTGDEIYIKDMVKSYHTIGIKNVIGVNWATHSRNDYFHAATRTRAIGKRIGEFILKITNSEKHKLKNIHLIGHSLGAQISGFAGQEVKNRTGTNIGRITALDAAAPLFEYPIRVPRELRISSDDADYVDAIHTNAGFLGFLTSFATADYYVGSGGPLQPGCINFLNVPESVACSHFRAYEIYNETITSKNVYATSCDDPGHLTAILCIFNTRVIMGEHTSTNVTGDFYMNSNSKYPFV